MGEMNFKQSLKKAAKGLWMAFPMILGTILLVSLISAVVPKTNPLTSYIFGGEMLIQGVGLVGVTAFLVCWVTVGLVQLPAESMILGRKFAILRNLTAFFLSIVVAIITVFLLEVIV
jgi:hypothetical protein